MSSVFNEALQRALNPKMPPPKSPLRKPTSPSRTSTLFQDRIKETAVAAPGPSSTSTSTSTSSAPHRPSTPRPIAADRDVFASGALPPLSLFPTEDSHSQGFTNSPRLPEEIRIPPFKYSARTYISNYPEDEADWSEPTPPITLDPGPCRNFRDPQAAAEEERDRHFAQQRQKRQERLVSASDALRDAPALPEAEAEYYLHKSSYGLDSTIAGQAGEMGSVYVPSAWRSRSKAEGSAGTDDIFSDVAEDGGDTEDDDEEEWDAEFARAEEEVAVEGADGREVGCEHAGSKAWSRDMADVRPQRVAKNTAPVSATTDPAAAPYVKHTPLTTTRDWAYPATSSPSPTESQLVASGFEFHNELSDEEQIARFGDKAFRKALREVLPSLSRKQQWYAWRRVNEGIEGENGMSEEGLREEAKEESGECECKCAGNGEECDGDDGTCGKLLNQCRCGDCGDCDEHYRWHHPDGACGITGELAEEPEGGRIPKCVCGKVGKETGYGKPVSKEQGCEDRKKTYYIEGGVNGEPDTWSFACGCGGNESNCQCPPKSCFCEDCPRSQAQHHRPIFNPEVADRPSDWTGLFSQGRLIDGEPASKVRAGLDVGHDVAAPSHPRIPGLGLLDQPSDSQPTHETIRLSVEPETLSRQLHGESTPAFEDRSPSPSPLSYKGNVEDVEMTDAPLTITSAPQESRLPLPLPTSSPDPISSPVHAVTAPQTPARPRSQSRSRSRSPAKAPAAAPDPLNSTPKSTKRGGRRKSAVQGSKVEKTSTPRSRAVSRKVTTAVKNAAEKAGGKVKEAVARIEASVKEQEENTPRRSARLRAKLEREGTLLLGDEVDLWTE